jgi:hypothetical protein
LSTTTVTASGGSQKPRPITSSRISSAISSSLRVKARTTSARVRIPTRLPSFTTGRRFTPSSLILAAAVATDA